MGLRGPTPVPSRILEMRGSRPRRSRAGELSYGTGAPTCPSVLSPKAKAEWRRVIRELTAAGVVAEVDRAALTAYCEAWGEFCELAEWVKQNPGDWRSRKLKNAAAERMVKMAAQFGFSPSARARLKAPETEEAQPSGKSRFFA